MIIRPYFERPGIAVYCGDVVEQFEQLPAQSFQSAVTSPPYWGQRDYGVTGQLGMEATPEEYIANQVRVCRAVRRVLRDDGTLWLNIGDSYANDAKGYSGGVAKSTLTGGGEYQMLASPPQRQKGWRQSLQEFKKLDLVGIPWMLAFALRADGWYLRSEIIWHKRSPMPESVRNRPTKSHEQIFLLSKSPRYYYDFIASQEPTTGNAHSRGNGVNRKAKGVGTDKGVKQNESWSQVVTDVVATRNMRSVWTLSSHPFRGGHFAAFPPELVRRCLIAGVSSFGCCPTCAAPFARIFEKNRRPTRPGKNSKVNAVVLDPQSPYRAQAGDIYGNRDPKRHCTEYTTLGWRPTCRCAADVGEALSPVPCSVLDPYHGAGTSMAVARRLGLNYVGVELNPDYIDLSIPRLDVPLVFPHERKPSKRKEGAAAR